MLGVLDGKGDPTDPDPINRVSAKVQTVVALYPPIDLRKFDGTLGATFFESLPSCGDTQPNQARKSSDMLKLLPLHT
jgi:hypothetical protein